MKVSTQAAVPHLPAVRSTLSCGADLIVSPRPGAPICAIQLHIAGGLALESLGGVAHLTGALVDRGTAERDEDAIASEVERMGGSLAGDATGVSATCVRGDFPAMVRILGEVVCHPTYPKKPFERERARLAGRLLVERDEPRIQAGRLFRRLVYGDGWLGAPEVGTHESVIAIQRKDVSAHHRRHWCGVRSLVVVCGDLDPEAVRRRIDRALADLPQGRRASLDPPKLPPLRSRTAVFPADREQVHVYLGHLGVRRRDPDYPALLVMDHVLGSGPGFANRVTGLLRDEMGLCYSVSAGISQGSGVWPGAFNAYIGTSPEHVETAIRVFLREMRRIREEPVSPSELELAKSFLSGSLPLGLERASRRCSTLVFAARCKLADDHLHELADAIAKVTADDVREAAARHLHPDAACVAASGPIKKRALTEALRAAE